MTQREVEAVARALAKADDANRDALCDKYRDIYSAYGEFHEQPVWHRWKEAASLAIAALDQARRKEG